MTPSAAVVDTLNSLLEAEANSIFHLVGAGSPYLKDAPADLRTSLEDMRQRLDAHERELIHFIRAMGGEESSTPPPKAEDQYLSFLSLRFLIPKLTEAMELMIQRHDNGMKLVASDKPAAEMLRRHVTEMQTDLNTLRGLARR